MEETTEVVDLEMLALYLEIKTEVVQRIQAECPLDIKRAKLRLFTFWIENDVNASWNKLTAALQSLDKRVLAKTISDKITGKWTTHSYLCRFYHALSYLHLKLNLFLKEKQNQSRSL